MNALSPPFSLSVLIPVYNERYLVEASIRRVLAFRDPLIRQLDVIVVDDGSTDGSVQVVERLAEELPELRFLPQARNLGKGAAIRQAIKAATGDLCVIHDADLEYNPEDWSRLLVPFVEANADAVYGSRFMGSEYQRVLYYRHTIGNRLLTLFSNLMTDLNLTDKETCYKMVRTSLLQSIPIRSDDFSFEPEITAKLAKRGAVIFEVPIRYAGRTYMEGKKINWRHGMRAIAEVARWKLVDDLYQGDELRAAYLSSMHTVQNINRWLARVLLDHVGDQVLELGAGIGNLTIHLVPRSRYVVTDINENHLAFLNNFTIGKPYIEVRRLDLLDAEGFSELAGQFDTVISQNLLERTDDEQLALGNIHRALAPGGKAIILVPQGQWLASDLDKGLGHGRRYSRQELERAVQRADFELLETREFNKTGVLGWAFTGRLLGRRRFSRIQLKAFNTAIPLVRGLDAYAPWHGLSLIAICRKPS